MRRKESLGLWCLQPVCCKENGLRGLQPMRRKEGVGLQPVQPVCREEGISLQSLQSLCGIGV